MSAISNDDSAPRPRSPWTGSQHQTQHRWQLDAVTSLAGVTQALEKLAAELAAAHHAGWWLVEPMRAGHLVSARASRRQRGLRALGSSSRIASPRLPTRRWRLRVVDEPPAPGLEVFDSAAPIRTPVLAWTGSWVDQVGGPDIPADVLAGVIRQVTPTGLPHRLWGLASARVGANFDIVAHGSALRLHAVRDGVLVRTSEALTFQHAADGAETLLQAAAAYERLARTADEMAAAGGWLVSADDGLLDVYYDPTAP